MNTDNEAIVAPTDETDPPCTSCHDTGYDSVMERYCQCSAGLACFADDDLIDCPHCDDGFVYDCIDGQCFDAEIGCDLCTLSCEFCS